jgi:predicted phage terminase large subunit-like protein
MSEPIEEQYDKFLVNSLIQNYGDLLKVSRSRGINKTLPVLREYLVSNPYVRESYLELLRSEQEGQNLLEHKVLNSIIEAQLNSFIKGDKKNNKMYSDEIKKIITEGDAEKNADGTVRVSTEKDEAPSLVEEIINNPLEVDHTKVTTKDANEARAILMNDTDGFEQFSKWCFEIQMGFKFQHQDFHSVIFQFCQKIVHGEIDRGIVTIPPRHSKTQILSIFLPLYSFCFNPTSHNIITSYADDVVSESSGYIRQIMLDNLFQKVFPAVRIDPNKRSLERWGTTKSGVMHAVPTGGKMTGKGAGLLAQKYSGVFVVDDAIKPKDAYSNTIRQEINDRYDNTFMSRLANDGVVQDSDGNEIECPRTPMVIIMQRVHDEDLVGHILRGGSSDKYVWLNIPGIIDKECGTEKWYKTIMQKQAYTHAVPYLYDLNRGDEITALWPSRKSLETLLSMKESTPYTFNSQYLGDPTAKGTGLVSDEWWVEYEELDKSRIKRTFMTADTASTAKDYSDYSVICLWGVTRDNKLVLIDIILGKWETPELRIEMIKFWKKHTDNFDIKFPLMLPTCMYLEDKSSGQFLNQQFTRDGEIRVMPVPKDKSSGDKVARFLNTVPYWAQGRIEMPAQHKHKAHIMREVLNMTGMGSGTGNDDFIDNVSDAVVVAFSANSANYDAWM